jgi:hypothetical protein
MNTDTSVFAMMVVVAWFAAGAFAVLSFVRHFRYVNSLPPTDGNRRIKLQHVILLLVGLAMLTIGGWNTYAVFGR